MGDLVDSIFQRQCSLTDPSNNKDHSRRGRSTGQRDTTHQQTDVTILDVGAQKTVDTYHCQSFSDLRDYFDRRNERNEDDSFWDDPTSTTRPSYLRLFFLPPLKDGHTTNMAAPLSRELPGFTEMLHEKVGLSPMVMDDPPEADEDSVSPTSSPRPSAVATRPRRARFAPDGLDEDAIMALHPQKEEEEPNQTWVWETRYTQSTTQTLSDPDTTTYFCVNYPPRLQSRILDTIQGLEALAKNPLFLDTLIVDEMISHYRDAIKVHRAQLLAMQNDSDSYPDSPGDPAGGEDDDDDQAGSRATELIIRLEELAGNWRTILHDIQSIQAHIRRLRALAETRRARPLRSRTPPPPSTSSSRRLPRGADFCLPRHQSHRGHTRQQSSDVFGPPAGEVLQLQSSTCDFWTRCVTMYLERTGDRIGRISTTTSTTSPSSPSSSSSNTYTLRKTIPLLRRRGSPPQLNRRLSNLTVEVAVQIQRNSSSVGTLALSVLSTIFFSPDGLLFAITYSWWILATLIVPLTFIVLHLGVETLASNTAFVRRRKAQRLGGVAEEGQAVAGGGEGGEGAGPSRAAGE